MNYISEMLACRESFAYFCKFIKIVHPKKGLIPFEPYLYQLNLVEHCDKNQYTILTKYRQGGFTTTMLVYGLWKALFNDNTNVFIGEKLSRLALHTKRMLDKIVMHLPDYMKGMVKRSGSHTTEFHNGSSIVAIGLKQGRGRQVDYLILDEPAFIPNMYEQWQAIFPTTIEGRVIALSTTNGVDSWFFETYQNAKMGRNSFKVFTTDYRDCPLYTPELLEEARKNLGPAGFEQEILGNFIIPPDKTSIP